MTGKRILRVLKFMLFAVLFLTVAGFVTMRLWNWLLPNIFGFHVITFSQAIGILILSKILFGGFRAGPGRHRYWRRRMLERWEQMTPEERERFREGVRGQSRSFGPPAEGKA